MSYGYLCQIKIKLIIIIIILQILSLSKGGFYHLRGIAITTCDWWNQRKKISEDKFDYHEKTVEMKKLLVMPLKSLSLLAAMTKEWHCFFDAFFHTHTKDWRAKISLYRSLSTFKFSKIERDGQNALQHVWEGVHIYKFYNLQQADLWKY